MTDSRHYVPSEHRHPEGDETPSIISLWPQAKDELLGFLRQMDPDVGPFIGRDSAATIEHLAARVDVLEAAVREYEKRLGIPEFSSLAGG